MTSSTLPERSYLALAVIGLVITWYFNVQFFAGGGSVAPESFFPSAFANPLTTAITLDVYWSALVFSAWGIVERNERYAPRPWIYIVLCFGIGLAFALPFYLSRRARARRVAAQDGFPPARE